MYSKCKHNINILNFKRKIEASYFFYIRDGQQIKRAN